MHVLRDSYSIDAEIRSCADPCMRQLIAARAEFARNEVDASEGEYDDIGELLNFILVEPGDTPQAIDAEMNGTFLVDHYGGRRLGDPAFVPCFESLQEHATFYDMEFIVGDEGFAIQVLVPKCPGIDPWLMQLCADHATPVEEPTP
jgi:hypothetical protein